LRLPPRVSGRDVVGAAYQRPGGVVDEQLERQRRALHLLAPPAAVARAAQPVLPELAGLVERGVDLALVQRAGQAVPLQHEVGRLAVLELERRRDTAPRATAAHDGEGLVAAQHETAGLAGEHRPDAVDHLDLVWSPGVVERRETAEGEDRPAPNGSGPAHQQVARRGGAALLRNHEVVHLAHGVGREEPGHQHVGVRQVELPGAERLLARQGEGTALVLVEQRGEQRWRVEPRRAVPVDRAVGADKGDGAKVADDGVLFDR
jgi:hypothetical protein